VLQAVRLGGALFFVIDAAAPWSAEVPPGAALAPVLLPGVQHVMSYHVVVSGGCWCALSGQASVRLEPGDVIVIPHGDPYVLSTAPDRYVASPLEPQLAFFRQMLDGALPPLLVEGGGGERLELACGFLGCDALPFNPMLATLPPLLHLRQPAGSTADRLDALLAVALAESREPRPGGACVRLRVSEVMFVEVLRRHLAAPGDARPGWLVGLGDPVVGPAIALLHQSPGEPWTLDGLARRVAASRSTLAARFTELVGEPPMHYLARWRMQVAARLLADGEGKIAAVALEVGYASEAAFSRAFKKAVGVPPAVWRDRARQRPGRAA
jgi:AraC-like DNA-binding protein